VFIAVYEAFPPVPAGTTLRNKKALRNAGLFLLPGSNILCILLLVKAWKRLSNKNGT